MNDAQRVDTLVWSSTPTQVAELQFEHLVDSQYYELRLAPGVPQVDYLAAFSRRRAVELRECVVSARARRAEYRTASWAGIERLIEDWAAGVSLAARRTSMLWFEYDDVEHQAPGAAPSISVCLLPVYSIDEATPERQPEDLQHAHEVLGLLASSFETPSTLEATFDAMPVGGRWIHISYMLGRPRRAVKLYGMVPRGELLPYLRHVGWSGDRSAIERALEELYPDELLGDELYVDLNLDDFRDPQRCSLGLAVAQQHLRRGQDPDPSRTAILARWGAAGLCDPRKLTDVKSWSLSEPHRRHPFFRDVRFLDVKLVWRAQAGWHAKAYLGRSLRRGLF